MSECSGYRNATWEFRRLPGRCGGDYILKGVSEQCMISDSGGKSAHRKRKKGVGAKLLGRSAGNYEYQVGLEVW